MLSSICQASPFIINKGTLTQKGQKGTPQKPSLGCWEKCGPADIDDCRGRRAQDQDVPDVLGATGSCSESLPGRTRKDPA